MKNGADDEFSNGMRIYYEVTSGADDIFVMLMTNLVTECILCYEVRTGTDGADETFWNIT